MQCITLVGLLLPYHRYANPGGISHPKLVANWASIGSNHCAYPVASVPTRTGFCSPALEVLRLTVAVVQSAFDLFARFRVHHRERPSQEPLLQVGHLQQSGQQSPAAGFVRRLHPAALQSRTPATSRAEL